MPLTHAFLIPFIILFVLLFVSVAASLFAPESISNRDHFATHKVAQTKYYPRCIANLLLPQLPPCPWAPTPWSSRILPRKSNWSLQVVVTYRRCTDGFLRHTSGHILYPRPQLIDQAQLSVIAIHVITNNFSLTHNPQPKTAPPVPPSSAISRPPIRSPSLVRRLPLSS